MQKRKNRQKKIFLIIGIFLCLSSLILVTVNIVNMRMYLRRQAEQRGEASLQQVSNDMQRTLEKSKNTLLRFAADVEVYLATGTDEAELRYYLKSQSNIFRDQSENTMLNAYICSPEWVIISDSQVPEGYSADGREWYNDTIKSGIDNIHISSPYPDAFTGKMCYTASLLLSDGRTIVALDYNISQIQKTLSQMDRDKRGEALIMSRNGTVVGYTESEYLGKDIRDVLPEYFGIYDRLITEEGDSLLIDVRTGGQDCTAFCNRSGDWLFVYVMDNDSLYSETGRIIILNIIPRLVVLAGLVFCYLYIREKYRNAPAAVLSGEAAAGEITGDIKGFTKRSRNGIMSIMILTITVAVAFTGIVLVSWGNDRMEHEIDLYNYQLERWMNTQLQTLNMFVDTIAANPSVLDEYDYAVEYLDVIVRNYPEISAAYIARPGNEHEMTMNNGWVPNADYIVAERQWYIDTETSENGMSVSSPYLDARTGLYCVTFSRVVYDAHTGAQIGIFALDFYIGNLTGIMTESYSDNGYAFLVDNSNLIVNHPNEEYQISSDRSTNIAGTEYSELKNSSSIRFIVDYDGRLKACISRTEEVTGFSVIAVKDAMSVYGIVVLCGGIFIALLVVCVVLLYNLIVKMMKWQEKARQALIGEAQRASQADHAKSSFLAQMSHEIRTPINAVLGMNEMILRESKEENTLTYASNAYSAGNALLAIINDVLDISKIEAGKLEIVEAEYDLYSLVSDCYHMTANRAEKKGLAFGASCDEGLPSRLKGDIFHVRQIVVNFITNAIKYTDSGSVHFTFSGERTDGGVNLHVSVKDTGIGLKPESMEKLFTSFQRFDLERNQSVEGSGLGLSICKQLAELMGGSVGAQSVYGEGSTFFCDIPQKIVNDAPIGEFRLDRPSGKVNVEEQKFIAPEARILVVDDVEMNLFVFSSFLKDHKMQIETASGGRKCIELAQNNKYDIIFMDHMMPEMDGIETFDRLRAEELITPETPVVMLTANAISGEEEKYMSKGFAAYLTKPVQSAKLEKILLKFLPAEKIIYQEASAEQENASFQQEAPDGEASDFFDANTGIMYNGGAEIYHKVLGMYVSSGAGMLEKISALEKSESWKDYIIEAHALKSTSMMIGSKQLSEAAKELELAGKSGNYDLIKEKNQGVLELYREVLAAARAHLEEQGLLDDGSDDSGRKIEELTEISAGEVREYIEKILAACEAYDSDEISAICEKAAEHSCGGSALGPLFGEVSRSAQDFEYDEAEQKARVLLKKFSGDATD